MKSLLFGNHDKQPMLGLGTWQISPEKITSLLPQALKKGYRHIDCAAIYGNEKEVGKALQEAFSQGIVTRDELWITSKLWCNAHRQDEVIPALDKTLNDLQLDYLDLYLMHWPVAIKAEKLFPDVGEDIWSPKEVPLSETWLAMNKTVESGKCRHVGVSNFSTKKIARLIEETDIVPEVNQVELHPYLQQPKLVDFCQQHNIHITAYSPLGRADKALLDHPVITEIASDYQSTPAQIILAWEMQRGFAVIPKTVRIERLEENLGAVAFTLSSGEMASIDALDKHHRYVTVSLWTLPGSPYAQASAVWDE
ncbi:MAG: aldo/keto reductase [Endozoicomonadaceae bacterium]|nr:aldo/keto reductase [Endozoicomonadaceae bacterium]MCY4330262.1 aldo/keto reductase [Endozoicomonadaceae bacterium]